MLDDNGEAQTAAESFLKLLAVGNKIEYFSGEWKFIKTLKINSQFKKENEKFSNICNFLKTPADKIIYN